MDAVFAFIDQPFVFGAAIIVGFIGLIVAIFKSPEDKP